MQYLPKAPGFYVFTVGDIEVICVNDGVLASDIRAVVGVSVKQVRALFDAIKKERTRVRRNISLIHILQFVS